MTDLAVATDLMLVGVRSMRADGTLREAMSALVELQSDAKTPNALCIVDDDDRFQGILTARLLFKSLLTLWEPEKSVREDDDRLDQALLDVVEDRSELAVRDTLIRGLPTARPGDHLLKLIELSCDKRLEFLPVVEDGRLRGVVPVIALFQAAASLALTPEHEGFRTDRQP